MELKQKLLDALKDVSLEVNIRTKKDEINMLSFIINPTSGDVMMPVEITKENPTMYPGIRVTGVLDLYLTINDVFERIGDLERENAEMKNKIIKLQTAK